eukprot:scaffold2348_cov66-Phaeocystis_antarctica.AAC.3
MACLGVPLVGVPVAREDRVGHQVLRRLWGDCGERALTAPTRVKGREKGGRKQGESRAKEERGRECACVIGQQYAAGGASQSRRSRVRCLVRVRVRVGVRVRVRVGVEGVLPRGELCGERRQRDGVRRGGGDGGAQLLGVLFVLGAREGLQRAQRLNGQTARKSAALQAASSSTRGCGWALIGSAELPRATRRGLRRRRGRAGALPKRHYHRAAARGRRRAAPPRPPCAAR